MSKNTRDLAILVDKNFGSIYNTSGGGKKQYGGMNVKEFLKNILGNRVLDIYLKYLGIKTLTTASLVPFGLILGKDLAEKLIVQTGGDILSVKIPFIDHPLIGNYLKLAGILTASLTTSTLVPLGILMVIHNLYNSRQTGGRVSLPSEYFKPQKNQKGGSRTFFASSIPPNVIQRIDNAIRGQPLSSSSNYMACQNGVCGVNQHSSYFKPTTTNMTSPGFPEFNISSKTIPVGWSGTYDAVTFSEIPQTMAGGSLEPNELRAARPAIKSVPTSQYGGSVNKSELNSYYEKIMNKNRTPVVNNLINKWQSTNRESLPNNMSKMIKKMSNDKRYSNKTIVKLFPKNILLQGLH